MGICSARFYFKEGLPKVYRIREKFKELTGLEVSLLTYLHLNELITERRQIAYHFYKSEETRDYIDSEQFEGDAKKIRKGLMSTGYVYFSCSSFHKIHLDYVEEKSFYLEYGIPDSKSYFSEALIKTMLEIGGKLYSYSISPPEEEHVVEDYLQPYHPHEERWKKIKKWDELSDYEKSLFKSKYAQ